MYNFLIPAKVLEVLPEVEELLNIPGYSSARMKEVISVIAINTQKDGWSPIKMEYLRWLVPGANNYLSVLRDLGIVQRCGSYVPGVKSFRYRFNPTYLSKYVKLPIECPKLIRRLEGKYRGSENQNRKKRNSKAYPRQNQFIRELKIDPGALKVINQMMDIEKHNYSLAAYTRINNGQIYYKVDKTAGRFHSPVTNFPSELREFIRIRGRQLLNVDIKNSQPYFITVLLHDPGRIANLLKDEQLGMMLKTLQVKQTEDVRRYVSIVKGRFYEYLQKEFAKEGHAMPRKDVKEKAFQVLFGSSRRNSEYKKIFARKFPEVTRVFNLIKGDDYRQLSILLQKVEAHLVLDVILPKVYSEGIIAVSIHDSIMTTPDQIITVRGIMERELTKFVGFPPRLKVEFKTKEIEINRPHFSHFPSFNVEDREKIMYREG